MSIRTRLLLIVLLAMLPPTLLVTFGFFYDYHSRIETAATDMTQAAATLAQDLDEKIQGTTQLLYGLARAQDLDTNDRAACSTFLGEVLKEYPLYTGILTVQPDGKLFCDSLNTGRDLDLRDRRYYREAVAGTRGITLEPTFGRLTGIAVVQIAYASRRPDGTLERILLASLNLNEFLKANAPKATLSQARMVLVDRRGTLLAAYPLSDRGKDRIGSDLKDTDLFRFAQANPDGYVSQLPGLTGEPQIWETGEWAERFGLPPDPHNHGYGHTAQDVAGVTGQHGSGLGGAHTPGLPVQQRLTGFHLEPAPMRRATAVAGRYARGFAWSRAKPH